MSRRPPPTLLKLLDRARRSPNGYVDIDRICALPFSVPMEHRCATWEANPHPAFCPEHHRAACPGTDADAWSEWFLLPEKYADDFRFYEVQCRAMRDWMEQGGLLAPIGVGWGKTLVTQWIAQYDWEEKISERVLLLVPPQVYGQTLRHQMPLARATMRFSVPVYGLGGLSPGRRRAVVHRRRQGLYVMPHSLLSVKDTEEILAELDPNTVVVDECHELVNLSAARARRFRSFMRARDRRAAFLSGTITKKSIREYAPFLKFALGEGSPLPTSDHMANDWAMVLDADADQRTVATGPLSPLRSWARLNFPSQRDLITDDRDGTRRAFQLRMNTTPGVVSTGDAEIGTSLIIRNLPDQAPPSDALTTLITNIETTQETPNGDPIEYPIHLYKWRFELWTTGGYNELIWPEPDQIAKRWGITGTEAEGWLSLARVAHDVHKDYARDLRDLIAANPQQGLDTPMLIGRHLQLHRDAGHPLRVPADLYVKWLDWKDAETAATDGYGRIVERDSRYVRVDQGRAQHVAERAAELHEASLRGGDNGGVLVWAHHQGFAAWIAEVLTSLEQDPPSLYCPAGGANNMAILDPESAKKIVVASLTGHGTGKNLQAFGQVLFAQTPRQASVFEQALGRNHRGGQWRDELIMHTVLTSTFEHMNYAAMLVDALYIQQTTGARQKAVSAVYDPMPQIVPPAVMRERGIPDARDLSRRMYKDLLDRFSEEG